MSNYNMKIEQPAAQQRQPQRQQQQQQPISTQGIPGTSVQQMWHVLNFHEHRLVQLTDHLHPDGELLQQIKQLNLRVKSLEASLAKSKQSTNVSLSIGE